MRVIPSRYRKRKRSLQVVVASLVLLLSACSSIAVTGELQTHGVVSASQPATGGVEPAAFTGTLRVLTLNLAHGRKDAFNQLFVSKAKFRRNLHDIAALLSRAGPDIVALQEADGPSLWSGSFDHVALLAREAGYDWYTRATHASTWLFDYGTALLSRKPFTMAASHAFEPTLPTPSKGLLFGQFEWQPHGHTGTTLLVDVVSVHLDFARDNVRQHQIEEIMKILANRPYPTIVLGDFNSDWLSEASVVAQLASQCGLHAYRPMADDLGTFRSGSRRFDWILLSRELEFVDYEVLDDNVSDHYAVVADIGPRTPAPPQDDSAHGKPKCKNE